MSEGEIEESDGFLIFVLYSAVFFVVAFFVRKFFKGGQFNERVSAKGLVAVVTGANCGIGFETVKELNLRKAKVYMLCRTEERGFEARVKLAKQGCDASRLIFVKCDLNNFESVRIAASDLHELEPHIDILINNAGIMYQTSFDRTYDGHEKTWQSNHLGPFLLTERLLPLLKKSPTGGRIVNVSSMLHRQSGKINLDKVDDMHDFGMMKAYNQSKLANVMHARQLARVLREEGTHNVTINSLHPGAVNTPLIRETVFYAPIIKEITAPFRWYFLKTSRDGAQTSLYLALSKKVEGISGKYFADCKLSYESSLALDDQACEDLYKYSLTETSKLG